MPRHSITALSSLSLLASWLVASSASALGYIDTQALNLADHAMTTEYLQMHFDAAEKELKQARCSCAALEPARRKSSLGCTVISASSTSWECAARRQERRSSPAH